VLPNLVDTDVSTQPEAHLLRCEQDADLRRALEQVPEHSRSSSNLLFGKPSLSCTVRDESRTSMATTGKGGDFK
jgi:type II secretory pathway predicted ATPase ExeA